MCGIFSYYSPNIPIKSNIVSAALDDLNHRGPDQQASWSNHSSTVVLAQTRLSINDLSSITIPLANENGSVQVVANAEIYNYPELKAMLQRRGYNFRTTCDIEVIPFLYQEHGINFVHKLRGEFSFVLWDSHQRRLFAVRDRFGVKPLYYVKAEDGYYFCSEIPTLLKLNVTDNRWDKQRIYDYSHLSLPYASTLFSGIHQVLQGHIMSFEHDKVTTHQYWDINYHSNNNVSSTDELIDAIREKIIDATRVRLMSDLPVGCYLSGGIDSSALLGIAAEYSSHPVEAFSLAFNDERVDESSIAANTAAFTGANHHILRVDETDFKDHFAVAVQRSCFPIPNNAGVARYLLSRFARDKGANVVLSGEGADEVFLGYFGAIIEAAEDKNLQTSYTITDEQIAKLRMQLPVNRLHDLPPKFSTLQTLLPHTPSWFTTQAYFNAAHRNVLDASLRADFEHYNPYLSLLNDLNIQDRFSTFDNVQISSYLWLKSFFPNTMLNWIGDRAEMAHSIEARQPYLDHELFELLAQVPTSIKLNDKQDKYLLRKAVKPFITDEIYQRKKFMFQAPPLKLSHDSVLFHYIFDVIIDLASSVGFYDRASIDALLNQARNSKDLDLASRIEISYTLTSIASTCLINDYYSLSC